MIQTKNKALGIEIVNKALKRVEEVIKLKKGNFLKKSDPKVVGEKEESTIGFEPQDQLESSEDENEEGMDVEVGEGNL
jgi:hypothetical protein